MGKKLSTTAAAKRAGVHRTTIYRAVERGRLKATKTPGGHLRIDEDDLKKMSEADPTIN